MGHLVFVLLFGCNNPNNIKRGRVRVYRDCPISTNVMDDHTRKNNSRRIGDVVGHTLINPVVLSSTRPNICRDGNNVDSSINEIVPPPAGVHMTLAHHAFDLGYSKAPLESVVPPCFRAYSRAFCQPRMWPPACEKVRMFFCGQSHIVCFFLMSEKVVHPNWHNTRSVGNA